MQLQLESMVPLRARMKKSTGTQTLFIKSGYQRAPGSNRATTMLSVVQTKVKLHFIKYCSYLMVSIINLYEASVQ